MDGEERYLVSVGCLIKSIAVRTEVFAALVSQEPKTLVEPREVEDLAPSLRANAGDQRLVVDRVDPALCQKGRQTVQDLLRQQRRVVDDTAAVSGVNGHDLPSATGVDHGARPCWTGGFRGDGACFGGSDEGSAFGSSEDIVYYYGEVVLVFWERRICFCKVDLSHGGAFRRSWREEIFGQFKGFRDGHSRRICGYFRMLSNGYFPFLKSEDRSWSLQLPQRWRHIPLICQEAELLSRGAEAKGPLLVDWQRPGKTEANYVGYEANNIHRHDPVSLYDSLKSQMS